MNVVLVGRAYYALRRLRELGHSVFVLCEKRHSAAVMMFEDQLIGWTVVESYSNVESMWAALVRHKKDTTTDAIVAGTELAVVSCAVLSKILNTYGQDPQIALNCRDKAVQKNIWNSAGIPTVPWAVISGNWTDQAISTELTKAGVKSPYVCKPLALGGATFVYKVDSLDQIRQVQEYSPILEPILVENYISAKEWHFDGFVQNGSIKALMVSQYVEPVLLTRATGKVASVAYPPSAYKELYKNALEFVMEAVRAIGLNSSVFHLEAFGDENHWLASEMACRPGGTWISEIAHLTLGLDIWAAHVDLTLGNTPFLTKADNIDSVYGLTHLPSMVGKVNYIDFEDIASLPGVIRVDLKVPKGEVMINSSRAVVVVKANTVDSCHKLLAETVRAIENIDESKR